MNKTVSWFSAGVSSAVATKLVIDQVEGGSTEYDEYLSNGSTVGLSRDVTLFTELEE